MSLAVELSTLEKCFLLDVLLPACPWLAARCLCSYQRPLAIYTPADMRCVEQLRISFLDDAALCSTRSEAFSRFVKKSNYARP